MKNNTKTELPFGEFWNNFRLPFRFTFSNSSISSRQFKLRSSSHELWVWSKFFHFRRKHFKSSCVYFPSISSTSNSFFLGIFFFLISFSSDLNHLGKNCNILYRFIYKAHTFSPITFIDSMTSLWVNGCVCLLSSDQFFTSHYRSWMFEKNGK